MEGQKAQYNKEIVFKGSTTAPDAHEIVSLMIVCPNGIFNAKSSRLNERR